MFTNLVAGSGKRLNGHICLTYFFTNRSTQANQRKGQVGMIVRPSLKMYKLFQAQEHIFQSKIENLSKF